MKRALLLFVLSLLAAAPLFAKDKDAAAEAKLKSEAAKVLAEYAGWCAAHGAKKDGGEALADAMALDWQAPKLAEARTALEALTEDAADAADAVTKQRKITGPKLAATFDKLAAIEHDPKENGQFEDYVFAALKWEPTPGRMSRIRKSVDEAVGANRCDEAGRLLVRLKRADADGVAAGKYEKTEIELATKDLLLLGSDAHALVGYVSLPKDWAKGKSFPVLVDVDGAGSNFPGSCRSFAAQRGSRPVIVLAPCTLSNTNELKPETYPWYPKTVLDEWGKKRLQFDGPGVDALLEVIRKRFGGEEKVFLTGFSGGGNFTYFKLLQDPVHVRGAAPACGNFSGGGVEGAPGAGADGGPPVHLFTGEKDPYKDAVNGDKPGIEGQTDNALENLRRLGYTHIDRTQVKGCGHDPLPALVWKFVDQVMGVK